MRFNDDTSIECYSLAVSVFLLDRNTTEEEKK
jgi:hypothetical protein